MPEQVDVTINVNGRDYRRQVEARMHLADFLRHELGLTGTHIGCEQGVCGNCTVLVDGQAIKSCLMFAPQADGQRVTTVESLAAEDELHPLQQAFKEEHGLQCGYCTPGFLMAGDRAGRRGSPAEPRGAARGAGRRDLPVHGLPERRSPRWSAISMRSPVGGGRSMSMAEVFEATRPAVRETGIGASVHRKEDDRLLRGEGRFADDVDPGHCLHMAVGRCPFPHARIVSIDISAALRARGVEDILVGSEVVRRSDPLSVLRPVPNAPSLDFYAMATDVALFEGHPVVSVAAVSRAVAEDAVA